MLTLRQNRNAAFMPIVKDSYIILKACGNIIWNCHYNGVLIIYTGWVNCNDENVEVQLCDKIQPKLQLLNNIIPSGKEFVARVRVTSSSLSKIYGGVNIIRVNHNEYKII